MNRLEIEMKDLQQQAMAIEKDKGQQEATRLYVEKMIPLLEEFIRKYPQHQALDQLTKGLENLRQVLERLNAERAPISARIVRVATLGSAGLPATDATLDDVIAGLRDSGLEAEVRDVVLPLRQLEPALALVLAGLTDGATAGPIQTPSGSYWLQSR